MDLLTLGAHGRVSVLGLMAWCSLNPANVAGVAALVIAIQVLALPLIDVAIAVHTVIGESDGSLELVRRRLRTLAALDVFVTAILLLSWTTVSSGGQVRLEPALFLFAAAAVFEWFLHVVACACSMRVKLQASLSS